MDIKSLVKPNVRSLNAYEAKEIPCKVKLDANESPYGFRNAIKAADKILTNRYPDPEAKALRGLIAKKFKVKPENLLFGNGSDELIYYLITTFGGPVLYPTPTFSMYGIISQALGERKVEIPLDREFDLDIEKMLGAIKKFKPRLIFISSPNNPTGNCFSSEKILKILSLVTRHSSLVVVDEAYQPFASEEGFLPMLKDYKNLIILRTLSKIGLAGLRVGFMIADEEIINEANKVRLPFNINSLSQAVAAEALKHRKAMDSYIKAVASERERLFDELSKINGTTPYPTEANFILFKTENPDRIYSRLLKKGVLVRNLNSLVKGCLRVTVGTPEENREFLNAIRKCLKKEN
ncbi:MAG: histidinol-phosphate transaminase [Nitrospirae bacterium]|nr:histidinol-phosphate transaminase [Nitrospirota bacterium]